MKRIGILLGLALAALALTNCSTKEIEIASEVVAEKEGVPFEIIALPSVETRTVAGEGLTTTWDATNDKLSVFHRTANTGSFTNDGEFRVADAETGTFSGTISENVPAAGNSYDWVAIYPYDANLTSFAPTNRYYYIGCRSDKAQSQNGTGSNAHLAGYKSDNTGNFPLWGKAENVAYNATASEFESPAISMNQVASVLAFNITNSTSEAISVSSIEFTATEDIVGAYYIDFTGTTPAFTPYNNYQSATAKLEVTNGTIAAGGTGTFYMGIKPFTVEGTAAEPKTLSMKVTTELGDTQVKTFNVAKTMTFSPNKFKNVNMVWNTEHVDIDGTFTQITSVSDITADGKYIFVLPDPVNNVYAVLNNQGESSNLTYFPSMTKTNGLLQMENPNNMYVWTVAHTSGSSFNFRNIVDIDNDLYSCIFNPEGDSKVDTGYEGSQYWTPEYLPASGCFKLYNSNQNPRFLSHGQNQYVVKAYLTSGPFHDQVAEHITLGQFCGAWVILKLGASALPAPEMSFSPSSVSIQLGDTFTAPTLTTTPSGLSVTYSSNAPDVATVDTNTGAIDIVGTGTATITASFAGNDSYRAASASYTIEVSHSSATEWVLVEDLEDLNEGEYVITWNNSLYLPNVAATSNPAAGTGITVANKKLTNTVTNDMIWKFTGNNTDGFAITAGSGSSSVRLCSTNSSTGISIKNNGTTTWKASTNAAYGMLLKGSDNGTRYLAVYSSNQDWRYYSTGSNYTGKLRLYKKTESDGKADAEIVYSPASGSVTFGATFNQPTLSNPHGLTGLQYTSSTPAVATVDSDGAITIVKVGTTTITASWADQNIGGTTYRAGSATYDLTVNKATPTVSFNNPTTSVLQGSKVTNVATTTPSGLSITYSSGTTAVATVNASTGEVTGVSPGTAVITATFAGNDNYATASDTYTIMVTSNGTPVTRTYTFTSKSWAATLNGSTANWTSGGDGDQFQNGRGVQVTKAKSGANATSPVSFNSVSKVVVTYSTNKSDGAGSIKVKVGSGTQQSQNVTKTGGTTDRTLTYTFNPNESGTVKLTVDCTTNSIYIKSIAITAL